MTQNVFPKVDGDIDYASEENRMNYGRLIESVAYASMGQKQMWLEIGSSGYYYQPPFSYTETIKTAGGDSSSILTNIGSTTALFVSGTSYGSYGYRTGMTVYDLNNNSSIDATRWKSGNGTFTTWAEDTTSMNIRQATNAGVSGILFASGTNQYNYHQPGSTVARFRLAVDCDATDNLNTRTGEFRFGVSNGTTNVILGSFFSTATNNNPMGFHDDSTYQITFVSGAANASILKNDASAYTVDVSSVTGSRLLYFYSFASSTGGVITCGGSLYSVYDNYTSGTMETSMVRAISGNNIKGIFVVPRFNTQSANGTAETVDVSIDGGTTYNITGQPLGSYIDTSSQTGSALRMRFKLTSSQNANYSELNDYFVQVYN